MFYEPMKGTYNVSGRTEILFLFIIILELCIRMLIGFAQTLAAIASLSLPFLPPRHTSV